MFTFSFGSAFAATDANTTARATASDYVTTALSYAEDLIDSNGDVAYNSGSWTISTDSWKLALTDAVADLKATIAADTTTETVYGILNTAMSIDSLSTTSTAVDMYNAIAAYLADSTSGVIYSSSESYAVIALQNEITLYAAELVAYVEAVDLSSYCTYEVDNSTTGSYKAYTWTLYTFDSSSKAISPSSTKTAVASEVAESLIAAVEDAIAYYLEVATASTATADDVTGAQSAMAALVGASGSVVKVTSTADEYGISYTTVALATGYTFLTTAEASAIAASDAATVASLKATIAANIAAVKASEGYLTADSEKLSNYEEYLAAYEEIQTYLVENGLATEVTTFSYDSGTSYVTIVESAATAIEDAAAYKAETNSDGSAKYDADTIDSNLVTELASIYKGTAYKQTNLIEGAEITYVLDIDKIYEKAAVAALIDEANQKVLNTGSTLVSSDTAYYALEWEAVLAAVEEYYAAVDAATVSSEIKDALADLKTAIAAISSADDVDSLYSNDLSETVDAQYAELAAYAAWIEEVAGETLVFDPDLSTENALVAYYIEQGARTASEIVALNSSVKAIFDAGKTASDIAAEAAVVKAMIEALPSASSITVADKDAIAAAYEAYEALGDNKYLVGSSAITALTKAITAVQKAELAAISTATKALPSTTAVTIDDKDAVQAVADMIAEYNSTDMYELASALTSSTVTSLETKIKTLETKALAAAIAAIPSVSSITVDDAATIEAARAAYDAYIAEYGADADEDAYALLQTQEKAIIAAEKALVIAQAAKDKEVTYTVESLKITASSSAKKGSITVKWTVSGDTTYVEAFEIWKSTKRSSGFKKSFTTSDGTKRTYKNTKGLKSGTRYYYKVRAIAYTSDGTKIKSDWSNKAYRKAK